MTKLLSITGSFVGSSAGWALGAPLGIFAAFVLSTVGLGLGIYVGRRVADRLGG